MQRRKQRKRPEKQPKKSRTTKKVLFLFHLILSLTFKYGTVTAPVPNDKELESVQPKDDDPDGLKLLGAADRLEQAYKLLHPLSTLAPTNIDVWIAIYDVAIRRSKLSLSIYCLFTMFQS